MKAILNEFADSRNLKALTLGNHNKEEKKIASKLKNPFICDTFYAFQTIEKLYYVIEYMSLGDLSKHLKDLGRYTEKMVKFFLPEIISALEFLHSNKVIYRYFN